MGSKQMSAPSSPSRSNYKAYGQEASPQKQRTLMQVLSSMHISPVVKQPPVTPVADIMKDPISTFFTYGERDESGYARVFDAQTNVELSRHDNLWFYDGSLVCRAENVLFRVHMSLLARQSVCFENMLAIPQPETELDEKTGFDLSQEKDGNAGGKAFKGRIPIIVLHDSAEDVENLLRALIDGPVFGNNGREDFRMVSGILRLATKYLFESLRALALAHLGVAWPMTLKGWEAREDRAQSYELDHPHKPRLYPHPFIFEPGEEDLFGVFPAPFPLLPLSDMQRFTIGKEAIHHMVINLIRAMGSNLQTRKSSLYSSYGGNRRSNTGICVSATNCKKDFSELMDLATQHYLLDRERGSCDPLYVAEELGQLKGTEFSECKACALVLECWASRERERVWKMIPGWFRLEPVIGAGHQLV
ncbi:hypothetical protein Ac2012v2_003289 [Leucoagaricus gongylophorus]